MIIKKKKLKIIYYIKTCEMTNNLTINLKITYQIKYFVNF